MGGVGCGALYELVSVVDGTSGGVAAACAWEAFAHVSEDYRTHHLLHFFVNAIERNC